MPLSPDHFLLAVSVMPVLLWTAGALLFVAGAYLGPPIVAKYFLRRRFFRAMARSGCVCLTFDDGPEPESTPKILELLRRHDAKATFFVLGKKAEQHPELIRAMLQDGHEVGEHSYNHLFAWTTCAYRTWRDLSRGSRAVQAFLTPGQAVSFRPPYGKLNLAGLLYVLLTKKQVIYWNVDPKDPTTPSSDEIARHAMARLAPGTVLLLHDGRETEVTPASVTVAALAPILEAARRQGLRLTTVREALSQS